MYIVTAIRDTSDSEYGVEIAGIFDDENKAYAAKEEIETWMEENEYENYEVFVTPMNINCIKWYDIDKTV